MAADLWKGIAFLLIAECSSKSAIKVSEIARFVAAAGAAEPVRLVRP